LAAVLKSCGEARFAALPPVKSGGQAVCDATTLFGVASIMLSGFIYQAETVGCNRWVCNGKGRFVVICRHA
jgi:hypothetical protein